jgi:type IV pilus assembly protein PilX
VRTRMTRAAAAQRGMALITALLLLIVMTILAVSMFRGYGMQEKIAGNVREKQRALNAAVSAQQFAEFTLTNGTPPITGTCAAGVVPVASLQICNAPLNDFTSTPWGTGMTFTQFTANSNNGVQNVVSGSNATAAKDTYYQAPLIYITDLGSAGGGSKGTVYQIDAVGFGGTDSAVAVVESTFLVSSVNSRWTDK